MYRYDPDKAPDAELWLSFDEEERIQLAVDFHRAKRIKLPNVKAHAIFHVIVENQLADKLESAVRAMVRLEQQGLSRHDCVHAIGWVLAQHVSDVMHANDSESPAAVNARYDAAVERLDAAAWLAQEQP